MAKKTIITLVGFFILVNFLSWVGAETSAPKDEKKLTALGKYVTALEAFEMWKADPKKVKIIDCRTPEEYAFVGHAPMAYNIPAKMWTGKFNSQKKEYDLNDNSEFEAQVKKFVGQQDTIIVMCRSGHRSGPAVNRLAKVGFTNVYNMVDGFEGDKVAEEDSCYKGKRIKNGWKNSDLTWTYDLDLKQVYLSEK
jgi:rhodanese-related sulfurtransferase